MNFAQRQADPRRHLVGMTVVVLFHALVVYALVTGLAKRVVEVIRAPIETKVIEEIKKPPPPPEVVLPPPPKLEAPPPPFIPPPEIQIADPAAAAADDHGDDADAAARAGGHRPGAAAGGRRRARAGPAPPAPVSAGVVCSNFQTVMGDVAYPREAQRQGIEKGEALIQFTLSPTGEVKNITVIRASHQIFARNSVRIVGEYKCQGQGREVTVQVPFGYKLQ